VCVDWSPGPGRLGFLGINFRIQFFSISWKSLSVQLLHLLGPVRLVRFSYESRANIVPGIERNNAGPAPNSDRHWLWQLAVSPYFHREYSQRILPQLRFCRIYWRYAVTDTGYVPSGGRK